MNCDAKMKCYDSKVCLAIANVCDNYLDCPYGDDETLCELDINICPTKCYCLNLGIMCQDVSLPNLNFNRNYFASFYLVNCSLPTWRKILNDITIFANFSLNTLCEIADTRNMAQLISIDMSHNDIEYIRTNSFSNLSKLSHIKLATNNISSIDEKAFVNLSKLHLLDMQGNNLTHFKGSAFHNVCQVHILNLRENPIVSFSTQSEILSVLLLDKYQFCCNRPQGQKCIANTDWYSTCCELLPSTALQVLFPLVFTVLLLCNIITVICSIYQDKKRTGHNSLKLRKRILVI